MVSVTSTRLPSGGRAEFLASVRVGGAAFQVSALIVSQTKSDLRRLWRVVRTAKQIIGTPLLTLQELYSSRVSKRAGKITLDPSHPAHFLFELVDATEL